MKINNLLQQAKYAALDLKWALNHVDQSGDYSHPAWETLIELDDAIQVLDPTWQTVVDWIEDEGIEEGRHNGEETKPRTEKED